MHRRTFARVGPLRAKVFFFVCFIVALFLAVRLCIVQAIDGPTLAAKALAQRSQTIELFARRGSILDSDGDVLVRSLPSQSVYVIPRDINDPSGTVAKLETIFGKLPPSVVADIHDRSLWFVWIDRKVPIDVAERVRALGLAGVHLKQEETGRRLDMVGETASTILGFVGTDETGLDGLEVSLNQVLRGSSGSETLEADEFGRPIPFGRATILKAPKPGLDVELTIDPYLQFLTEEALKREVEKYHARDGTAIVMDPWTGAILAMVNLPQFDPNHFWRFPANDERDRAVTDAYEPGSTFKLVTAAAALSSGKVSLSSRFPARDTLEVGGRTIHNADDDMPVRGSTETLEQIVQYSHNVGAAEVGLAIGAKTFYGMERKAGFGDPTDVELPGESPGIVPAPPEWSATSLATMAFGQGVAVTPLAMARYYCAIANGGLLLRPRIVHAILEPAGQVVYTYPREIERRVFSRHIAAELRSFLRAVVTGGTGDPAAQIPGYTTAGKTGTAQMVEGGVYAPGDYVASFIGMIPYEHPRYVIYVKVERPIGSYYGSEVAAPAFDEIARGAMLHAGILPSPSPGPKQVAHVR
jgi:stage V sporulation protein D (sporulation-specific penicillin-binding protein)